MESSKDFQFFRAAGVRLLLLKGDQKQASDPNPSVPDRMLRLINNRKGWLQPRHTGPVMADVSFPSLSCVSLVGLKPQPGLVHPLALSEWYLGIKREAWLHPCGPGEHPREGVPRQPVVTNGETASHHLANKLNITWQAKTVPRTLRSTGEEDSSWGQIRREGECFKAVVSMYGTFMPTTNQGPLWAMNSRKAGTNPTCHLA